MRELTTLILAWWIVSCISFAQQPPAPTEQNKSAVATEGKEASVAAPAVTPSTTKQPQSEAKATQLSDGAKIVVPEGGLEDRKVPAGSKIYVAPMQGGFDTYVVAGLQQKKVPVVVVVDRDKADYEITGVADSEKAGWAKMLFAGTTASRETASIKVVNLKTGAVVFAYSVHKGSSARGRQSAGEACAKHLKEYMEGRTEGVRLGS